MQARDDLLSLVYRELKRRAAAYVRRERRDHTLQPTALVHEVYVRLVGQERVAWQNRAHFFGIAAQMMRRILVDHAREHKAAKRPLQELTRVDARQAQIVELRYFGGMSEQEVARVLSLSRATVTREWQSARCWDQELKRLVPAD